MRTRAILLLALMAASLVVASGVAWAAQISCPNRSGNLCVGTNNRDTMTGRNGADEMRARGGNDTLKARGGNDKLDGGGGSDSLQGAGGRDLMVGQGGNDSLGGASGNDTYRFYDGWGEDLIGSEGGGVDTLDFSDVANVATVNLTSSVSVSEAVAGNSSLNFPSTVTIENVHGTDAELDDPFGLGPGDTLVGNQASNGLFGNGSQDDLFGRGGSDNLLGGPGQDDLFGEAGNDALKGGDFGDRYWYEEDGWGHDTITDPTTDNGLVLEINFGFGVTTLMTINLNSSTTPGSHEVANADSTSTVNWSGNVINGVQNFSTSNDTVIGNDASNDIVSVGPSGNAGGVDQVFGGGGNDLIRVDDRNSNSSSRDSVDCGLGTDHVIYDAADHPPVNCETSQVV